MGLFFANYQSLVWYYFVVASSTRAMNSDGKMSGVCDVIAMVFTCVVVYVDLRLLMMCNTITRWHHISVGGSILPWFIFIFMYSGVVLPKAQGSAVVLSIRLPNHSGNPQHDPENSKIGLLAVGNTDLTPDEARSYAIMQLPGQKSKHTCFAFDSPGYESFFASHAGCCSESQHEVDNKNTA